MGRTQSRYHELQFGKRYERAAAAAFVAEQFGVGHSLIECPAFADIDWMVQDDKGMLAAFVEVKTRRVSSTKYASTIVSKRKTDAGRYGKFYFKVPSYAVVVFTDNFGVFKLHEQPDGFEPITRYDRPGVEVEHAVFKHERLEWYPHLLERMVELLPKE